MRTEIPLLQNVRVASPCRASWEEMTPVDADRVRFCDGCRKRVYNLSALCQAEAEGLLRAHEGHLCVRYYRRHDGTILTADCPVGLRAARQLVLTRTRVSAGLCLLLCTAFAAHQATTRSMGALSAPLSAPEPADPEPAMGDIAAPPTPRPLMGAIKVEAPPEPIQGSVAIRPAPVTTVHPVLGEATTATEVVQGRTAHKLDPPDERNRYEVGKVKPTR